MELGNFGATILGNLFPSIARRPVYKQTTPKVDVRHKRSVTEQDSSPEAILKRRGLSPGPRARPRANTMKSNASNQMTHFTSLRKSTSISEFTDRPLDYYLRGVNLEGRLAMLYKRLAGITGAQSPYSIRLSRDEMKKICLDRWSTDRLLNYLDFEYLEDYDSMSKRITYFTGMSQEECQAIAFVLLDVDRDGLISSADLYSISLKSYKNDLVMKDIYKMIQYVDRESYVVRDEVGAHDTMLGANPTFKRIKLEKIRRYKQNGLNEGARKGIRRSVCERYFSLSQKDTNISDYNVLSQTILNLLKSFSASQAPSEFWANKLFKINFYRFQKIFKNEVPLTMRDILYVFCGLYFPNTTYSEVLFKPTVLTKMAIAKSTKSRYEQYIEIVDKLRSINHQLPKVMFTNPLE